MFDEVQSGKCHCGRVAFYRVRTKTGWSMYCSEHREAAKRLATFTSMEAESKHQADRYRCVDWAQ